MREYSWTIERSDWPWNKTHGQDGDIVIRQGDAVIMRIAAVEVIEGLGLRFVQAHVEACIKQLPTWRGDNHV